MPVWATVLMPSLAFLLTLPATAIIVSEMLPTAALLEACFDVGGGETTRQGRD